VADSGKIIGCTTDNTVRSKVQDIANNCDPRILIHADIQGPKAIEIIQSYNKSLQGLNDYSNLSTHHHARGQDVGIKV